MTQQYRKHIDGQGVAQLIDWQVNPKATDPGSPVENVLWINTTDKRLSMFDGAVTQKVAWLSDLNSFGTNRGVWDASTGIPTAAGSTIDTGDVIVAGDYWRVTVGGTIAGIGGSAAATIQPGDIIYADADGASTAADFYVIQGNPALSTAMAEETIALTSLPANTSTNVASTLSNVSTFEILDAASNVETESYDVVMNATSIDITSLTAEANLSIRFTGSA